MVHFSNISEVIPEAKVSVWLCLARGDAKHCVECGHDINGKAQLLMISASRIMYRRCLVLELRELLTDGRA